MKTKNISDIEYAIREKNKTNIKKILKQNSEEIKKIQIHTFIDIIHFNEFDLLETILKSINKKFKIFILSNNEIIIKLLNSNNIETIKKYIKYMYLDALTDDKNIINICINTNNLELVKIIYKIYKTSKKYSLLDNIILEYANNNIKVNLELINFLIEIDRTPTSPTSEKKTRETTLSPGDLGGTGIDEVVADYTGPQGLLKETATEYYAEGNYLEEQKGRLTKNGNVLKENRILLLPFEINKIKCLNNTLKFRI